MANFGGFEFDEEVFSGMMEEADYWRTPIIASSAVRTDQDIMNLIGEKGNVATIPMYKPLNAYEDGMEALNNDGETNNTPVTISGNKQTCMLMQRMKAFKAQDFTAELTGADPLTHIRNKVAGYYAQVWEKEMMNIAKTVLSLSALSGHVIDLATASKAIEAGTVYDLEAAALGDMAGGDGILFMHSKVAAFYKKMDLIEYKKYTLPGAIQKEVELPTLGGKVVSVTDNFTVDSSNVYSTYLFGEGAFLTCEKKNYKQQYYTDYDPESLAGVEKLYTKQGRVLHPNGISLKVDNIAKASPTYTELGTTANWELKFNPKNVKMGVIKSVIPATA